MSTFITADQHFGHANIIKYCNRPFADTDEMDQIMIDRWNEVIKPEDTVYHLGDFTLMDSLSPWIHALQFHTLHIVPGGHDYRWLDDFCPSTFDYRIEILPPLFTLELPSGGKYPKVVVLCHYPMLSWDRSHYGALHLHGHSHCTIPDDTGGDIQLPPGRKKGHRIDVGVDCWKFFPVGLNTLVHTYYD